MYGLSRGGGREGKTNKNVNVVKSSQNKKAESEKYIVRVYSVRTGKHMQPEHPCCYAPSSRDHPVAAPVYPPNKGPTLTFVANLATGKCLGQQRPHWTTARASKKNRASTQRPSILPHQISVGH